MSNTAPVAKNRAVRLLQELVPALRATGSIQGADLFWQRINFKKGVGRKLVHYGFDKRAQQLRINKVAFPSVNFVEVEAALRAGNRLHQLYQVAVRTAAIARDAHGRHKFGRKGLKIIRMRID
jgi:hypothetical protein